MKATATFGHFLFMLREMATEWRSHRLFDLLILGSELLGLVDPLPLVFGKNLQVQLQTHSTQVTSCYLNKNFPLSEVTNMQKFDTFKTKL